jgi:hypothetical protein
VTKTSDIVGAWCDENFLPPDPPELVVQVLVRRADGSLALATLHQDVLARHAPSLLRLHGVAAEANRHLCVLASEVEPPTGVVLAAWPDATGELVVVFVHEGQLGVRYVPLEKAGLAHLFEALVRSVRLTAQDVWRRVAGRGAL